MGKRILAVIFTFMLAVAATAQVDDAAGWAARAGSFGQYTFYPDVVYGVQNNDSLKLDVWKRTDAKAPRPTLIAIHGGGWIFGTRLGAEPLIIPFTELGWNIVNVEYRFAHTSLAPAAVEDCRCALRWVIRNAKEYNIDVNRLVITGHSAGGHLALTTAMLTKEAGLDRDCPGTEDMKVAAVVNWYGVTDVADLLEGPNTRDYAVEWMGSQKDRMEIAKQVSPLTYVRSGLPPIISIHGDADPVVPYSQAVRLHDSLTKAGVPNELVTIHGGGHGMFTPDQLQGAYLKVLSFLKQHMDIQ